MTDPAERRSLIPRGTFDRTGSTDPIKPASETVPLSSYIDELRARVETLPDQHEQHETDDAALTVPPDATLRPWVAPDIEAALHAAAETVPRSPSSPDSPASLQLSLQPSVVPAAELSPRHVRRPRVDAVEEFPVELERASEALPTLRSRERGRKSGRFVSPAGLRAAVEEEGSIANALKQMIEAERAKPVVVPQSEALPNEVLLNEAPSTEARVTRASVDVALATETPGAVVLRMLVLFTTASIAGASAVYFLLHG